MAATDKPVALIVGAGDHLGSAIARRFAIEGLHIQSSGNASSEHEQHQTERDEA